MQAVTPERVGAHLEQHFGDATAAHGSSAYQVNVQGDINFHRQSEDDRCLADLRETDPTVDKERIEQTKGGLLKDSYRWILENDDFRQWHNNPESQLLWIKGDPGKGKTMLICGIIDELESTTVDDKHKSHLAYFFCQATDSRLNNAIAVLRGLIYLLIRQQPSLISNIPEKYRHAVAALFKDQNAWWELSKMLKSILQDPGTQDTYLIIDALDECVEDLGLLLNFIANNSTAYPRVKWIVSSRNWPDIDEGLDTAKQKMTLCLELSPESISAAVGTYIQHKVDRLSETKKYTDDTRDSVQRYLNSNAKDTFLWVALVCQELDKIHRFHNPLKRLKTFPPGLDAIYQQMIGQMCKLEIANLCKQIIAVVCLAYRPITLGELKSMVDIAEDVCNNDEALTDIIGLCGSLLTVRDNTIFFVHQSAKDFLLEAASDGIFLGGKEVVHRTIFSRSLQVMSATLKQDIYKLDHPGIFIDDIKPPIPDPLATVKYACVYWFKHLCSTPDQLLGYENALSDNGLVFAFLEEHFLHWLEALSLIGELSKSFDMIDNLLAMGGPTRSTKLSGFLHDAKRFVPRYFSIVSSSPLQLYSSALIFAPQQSIIRNTFQKRIPSWILLQPKMEVDWHALLLTLEDHSAVNSVTFSHDSKLLASGSNDQTVMIWNVSAGSCQQTLEGHNGWIRSVSFSHDSKLLASASYDKTIKIWKISTGSCQQTLEGQYGCLRSVSFSHDSKLLALMPNMANDKTIKIWNMSATPKFCQQTLEGHTQVVTSVAFSHNSKLLASASRDKTIKIWDLSTSCYQQVAKDHSRHIDNFAFDRTFEIDRIGLSPSSHYPHERKEESHNGLAIDKSWITWKEQKLLWLPPNYRDRQFCISPSGSIISTATENWNFIIIGFSLTGLKQRFG
ncbi:Vegetative incompatibility protein [Lachnellula occidentalis]|uniref:Vegetative incompatibility protein n=1 Tax=Lachnellula occidentalis TaxID=215460 RepID=A0A8H8UB70_9HELO|nr:Vegetative incompatibility protein [Lachnellula occidentalis]